MLKAERSLGSPQAETTNLSKSAVLLVIVAFSSYSWKLERSSCSAAPYSAWVRRCLSPHPQRHPLSLRHVNDLLIHWHDTLPGCLCLLVIPFKILGCRAYIEVLLTG